VAPKLEQLVLVTVTWVTQGLGFQKFNVLLPRVCIDCRGRERERDTTNVHGGRTEDYLVATSPGGVEGSRMNTSSTLCCATLR
jgi:hypothetical protein